MELRRELEVVKPGNKSEPLWGQKWCLLIVVGLCGRPYQSVLIAAISGEHKWKDSGSMQVKDVNRSIGIN